MRKGDEKKQAILAAARHLFYERGYEQTSINDILHVLGCSKGSFYHHFETKYQVLETLCRQQAEATLQEAQATAGKLESPLEQLCALLHTALPIRPGQESFLLMILPASLSDDATALLTQYSSSLSAVFAPVVDDALESCNKEGTLHVKNTDLMAEILMQLLASLWQKIARYILQVQNGNAIPEDLLEVLTVYRFSMERLTDAPYGSIQLLNLEETFQVIGRVVTALRAGNS